MEYQWYLTVDKSSNIQQGDFIEGMRVPKVSYSLAHAKTGGKAKITWVKNTWVVMSQSCDLNPANNKAPEQVLICPVARIKSYNPDRGLWKSLLKNKDFKYHALRNTDHSVSKNDYLIVDFSRAQYANLAVLSEFAKARRGSRLRLNSPYLESLSKRFGTYFSRVAYPIDFPTNHDIAQFNK